ncbi:MAG: hypothetical protein J0I12_13035 [Candidatus Eremiobacteraeota bacterium]|nr:hypothetical protein [Candidatus Eremiobacteraeota bacterium]
MIQIQDENGLSLWPEQLIVSITPAYPNRLCVTCADGTVGYMPHPIPPDWPSSTEYQPEPHWGLLRTPDALLWDGSQLCLQSLEEATQNLFQAGRHLWLHPRRIRRVSKQSGGLLLLTDEGTELVITPHWSQQVLKALHIPYLPDAPSGPFLRDYPFELARASAAVLRQHFADPNTLIANLIWQQLVYHQSGIHKGYGTSPRGFWYVPGAATLARLGSISAHQAEMIYYRLLVKLIDDDRLFGYRDLGFADPGADSREIGTHHPGILLVIEKTDLAKTGVAAARHFGLSWHITGGISRLFTAEFCAYALQQAGQQSLRTLIFGDYDPGGRVNGRAIVAHLDRFGTPTPAGPEFLIDASAFTEEELELFSHPLSQDDERVQKWLQETGGIHGQPNGIHADWLQPPERLLPLIEAKLSLAAPAAPPADSAP